MTIFPEYVSEGMLASSAMKFARIDRGNGSPTARGKPEEPQQLVPTRFAAILNMYAPTETGIGYGTSSAYEPVLGVNNASELGSFGPVFDPIVICSQSMLAETPHTSSHRHVMGTVVGTLYAPDVVGAFPDWAANDRLLKTFVRQIDLPGNVYGMIALADPWLAPPQAKRGLNAAVRKSLDSQRSLLSGLRKDWDGYGAEPLPKYRVKAFISELESALEDYSGPLPEIIPGADGSLQAEWHRRYLTLFYGVDSEDARHLFLKVANKDPITLSGDAAILGFVRALQVHFPRGADAVTNAATK